MAIKLEDYIGKHIKDICENGFHKESDNHCGSLCESCEVDSSRLVMPKHDGPRERRG